MQKLTFLYTDGSANDIIFLMELANIIVSLFDRGLVYKTTFGALEFIYKGLTVSLLTHVAQSFGVTRMNSVVAFLRHNIFYLSTSALHTLACSPRSFLGKRDVGLVPALL